MRRSFRAVLALVATSAALLACSSSSSGSSSSSDCAMTITLSGAVNTTFGNDVGCGNAGDSALEWIAGVLSNGPAVNVSLDLASDLSAGQTGSVQVTDVTVAEVVDGGAETWITPAGACTANITSNTSNPDSTGTFKNRYTVTGNGSCSQPAAADPNNGAQGNVTVGSFSFTGFIDPP